jgi:hypothetical protein
LTRALAVGFLTIAALVGVALAIALGVGAPHPAVLERAAAGAFGLLGIGAGSIALSTAVETPPRTRPPGGADEPPDARTADLLSIERSLRFGASTAGDFYAQTRPRLVQIASACLARKGVALSDRERAADLLGADAFELVDPYIEPPTDRFARGVPLSRVRRFVGVLEALEGDR